VLYFIFEPPFEPPNCFKLVEISLIYPQKLFENRQRKNLAILYLSRVYKVFNYGCGGRT
jgi:hypothetical protein